MYRNIQGSGLIEIVPGYASSPLRVSILFFCIPNSPQGTLARVAAVADGLMVDNILCLLRWQVTFFFFFAHRYHLFLSGWVVCKISWPLSQVIHLTQMAPECSAPWVLEEDVTMLPLSNPVDRWCALLIKMESPLWGPEACWETDLVVFHMAEWSAAQECEDKYSTSLCIY